MNKTQLLVEQWMQEKVAELQAQGPIPAYHAKALNPDNQKYLNRDNPYKQIALVTKPEIIEREWYKEEEKPGLFNNLVAGIGLLVLAAFLVYATFNLFDENRKLATSGVTGQATVVDKQIAKTSRLTGSSSQRTSTDYRLTYELSVPGADGTNRVYRQEKNVPSSLYSQYKVGSKIEVRYLPSDPTVTFLPGTETQMGILALASIVISPILLVVSLYMFWQLIKQFKFRRALKKGQYLAGRVEAVAFKKNLFGKPVSATVNYSFSNPNGLKLQNSARVPLKWAKHRMELRQGLPVTVLYLSDSNYEVM